MTRLTLDRATPWFHRASTDIEYLRYRARCIGIYPNISGLTYHPITRVSPWIQQQVSTIPAR
jgi:hypothetical protein